MWFRVSAEGRREFVHHSDPNQVSLSYRGRTRYENDPFRSPLIFRWFRKLAKGECRNLSKKWIVCSSYIGGSYSSCSVQIRVVKLSDGGDYHFRFETDQPLGRWTSPNTVRLDVTGISTQAETAASSPFGASLPSCRQHFSPYACQRPSVLRPAGWGAPSQAHQHVRLGRDRVCGLPGQRLCCSWEEPRAVQVRLICSWVPGSAERILQLSFWELERQFWWTIPEGDVLQNGICDVNTFNFYRYLSLSNFLS